MLDLLFSFITKIISFLSSLVLTPIVAPLSLLIPNFTQFFSDVLSFIGLGLTYFSFFCKLLMIPFWLITTVLSFSTAILVFNVSIKAIFLFVNIYRTLKP